MVFENEQFINLVPKYVFLLGFLHIFEMYAFAVGLNILEFQIHHVTWWVSTVSDFFIFVYKLLIIFSKYQKYIIQYFSYRIYYCIISCPLGELTLYLDGFSFHSCNLLWNWCLYLCSYFIFCLISGYYSPSCYIYSFVFLI